MKGDMEIEMLTDPSDEMGMAKCKKRMARIVADKEEQMLAAYSNNASRDNARPGYPCEKEDY
jgi:hypothetical protein